MLCDDCKHLEIGTIIAAIVWCMIQFAVFMKRITR